MLFHMFDIKINRLNTFQSKSDVQDIRFLHNLRLLLKGI